MTKINTRWSSGRREHRGHRALRQAAKFALELAFVLTLSAPLGPASAQEGGTLVWPTTGWPVASPSEMGINAAALEQLDAEFRAGDHGNVDAMLVIRRGRVVADHLYELNYEQISADTDRSRHQYNYYHPDWHPYLKGSDLHTLQSVTKSVTSALIGIAIARGEIESTDVHAMSFFFERQFENPDGRKSSMTLHDMLTMRAGFAWDEWSAPYTSTRNDCAQLEKSDDWVQFVLDKPMATQPGSTFVYNSGNSHLLSAIIKEATGETIDEYAERYLFGPLGITEYHWKKTPKGLPDTEGGLYLKPRDLAKIGYLYLHDGVWAGQRILPERWVERSVRAWVSDTSPRNPNSTLGYGFQWWIISDGLAGRPFVYGGMGYGGQYVLVAPEYDLVGVFNAWNIFDESPSPNLPGLFVSRIVSAVGAVE